MALDRATPEFAEALGQAIVELSYYFCGVPRDARPAPGGAIAGFDKLAPIYASATEYRDGPGPEQRKRYSSCGDQLHAILDRIGVRESWVNRASLGQYLIGANILRLHPPACEAAQSAIARDPAYIPPPGSLCLIWSTGDDAHALVVLGQGSSGHLLTGNYGAGGMSPATTPGANVADSPYAWDPVRKIHTLGAARRSLQSVIEPAALARHITAQIDLTGAPVGDDLIQALGARYDGP